jgi:hypothetical protein
MSWIKYDGTEWSQRWQYLFGHNIALYVVDDNEDHRSKFIKYYRQWSDWLNR